jgi:hypothetical protein
MIHFLKIGFDLELYAAHEMKSIFWYHPSFALSFFSPPNFSHVGRYLYQLAKTRKEQHFVLLRYDQHQIPEIQAALMRGKKKVGKLAGKGTTGKAGAKSMSSPYFFLSFSCVRDIHSGFNLIS